MHGQQVTLPHLQEEAPSAALLKQTHERGRQRFRVVCGHFVNLALLQHVAAVHSLMVRWWAGTGVGCNRRCARWLVGIDDWALLLE